MNSSVVSIRDAVMLLRKNGWTVIPPEVDDGEYPFEAAWEAYQKKRGDKAKLKSRWDRLPKKDKKAAMEHIPLYVASTPDKMFRKDFSTYINNKSWNDEIISTPGNGRNRSTSKEDAVRNIIEQYSEQASGQMSVDGEIQDPF